MATIDTATLSKTIEQCYDALDDAACPIDIAQTLRIQIKSLEAALAKAAPAQFNATTDQYTAATLALAAVNKALSGDEDTLTKISAAVDQITSLATALDGLVALI